MQAFVSYRRAGGRSLEPIEKLLAVGAMLVVLATPPLVAQQDPAEKGGETPAVALDELAFVAGAWRGELGGAIIEEHWSTPEGDNMMGMFRFVKDGRVTFYEMQAIELDEEGHPILRIKHYHPGLRGWEEKDEAVTFTLREVEGERAVFDDVDSPTQLVYRVEDGRLSIELIKNEADGSAVQRFEFGPLR